MIQRWVRFVHAGATHFGTLEGDAVRLCKGDMFVQPEPSQALLKLADQQLEKFVTTRYPRLTTRWWGTGYRDRDSYGAGVADGGNITLHRGSIDVLNGVPQV